MKRPILVQCACEICAPDKPPHKCQAPSNMLHFIRKGKGTFNGVTLSAGQGFLARYGTLVHYYPDPDDPWEYAWVNFYDKEILETLEHLIAFDEQYTFSFDMAKPYFDMIADVDARRVRVPYTYDITYARTALYYELIGLFTEDSHRKGSAGAYASARRKHVSEAKRLIENNYYRTDFNMQALADKLHLNRAYLRNIFSEYEHVSPKHYLVTTRMTHARAFLEDADMPIHFVANSVGYEDPLQFTKMFKHYFGVSPKQFRERKEHI